MNRSKLKALCLVAIVGMITPIWGGCQLTVNTARINPVPLIYLADGSMRFDIIVGGADEPAKDAHGAVNCTIEVNLAKVELKNNDVSSVFGSTDTKSSCRRR